MMNLTLFIFYLFMFSISSSQTVFQRERIIPINQMTRSPTRTEIRNLKPYLDATPTGTEHQHPNSGMVADKKPAIIGGKPAVVNQFPWMVATLYNNAWFCGGSVISASYVLTAGHCVLGATSVELYMGSINWLNTTDRLVFTSTTVFLHPKYNDFYISNDIGLIQLKTPINVTIFSTGKIIPIRLPRQSQATVTFVNKLMTVSGWGLTKDGGYVSTTLNFVTLKVISNVECARVYGTSFIFNSTLCTKAGIFPATNICSGDSGSALQMKDSDNIATQYGIVSFNAAATCFGFPSGFTRITSFLGYISGVTGLAIRP